MRERLNRASKTFSTAEAGGNLVNNDSQSSTYTLQAGIESYNVMEVITYPTERGLRTMCLQDVKNPPWF